MGLNISRDSMIWVSLWGIGVARSGRFSRNVLEEVEEEVEDEVKEEGV